MAIERIVLFHSEKNVFGKMDPDREDHIDYGIERKHVYKAVSVVLDPMQITATARFEYDDGTMDVIQANSASKEANLLEWTHREAWNSEDSTVHITPTKFRRMVYKKLEGRK